MFALYRVATVAIVQSGWSELANIVQLLWLGFVVYTWVGPMAFNRMLRKEFATVRLRRGF
jgi:hypothetical protein